VSEFPDFLFMGMGRAIVDDLPEKILFSPGFEAGLRYLFDMYRLTMTYLRVIWISHFCKACDCGRRDA
jgi:hypothetical protein